MRSDLIPYYVGSVNIPDIRGQLKNDRHDSSNTEMGVLTANTGHRPIAPEGGTSRHRNRIFTITMPTREART
ncbi:hypothetical protein AVEN_163557-1, partial [Araneus ventricosus]